MLKTTGNERVNISVKEQALYHSPDMLKAADLLKNAHKPLIFTGSEDGLSEAADIIRAFTENYDAPFAAVGNRCVFDENDNRFLGTVGETCYSLINKAVSECDVLLCIGGDFFEIYGESSDLPVCRAKKIFIGEKNETETTGHGFDCFIYGNVKAVMTELYGMLPGKRSHESFLEQLNS